MRINKRKKSGSSYLAGIARDAVQPYRSRPTLRALLHLSRATPLWPKKTYFPFHFSNLNGQFQGAQLLSATPGQHEPLSLPKSPHQGWVPTVQPSTPKAPAVHVSGTPGSPMKNNIVHRNDTTPITVPEAPVTTKSATQGEPRAPQEGRSIPEQTVSYHVPSPKSHTDIHKATAENPTTGFVLRQTEGQPQTNTKSTSKNTAADRQTNAELTSKNSDASLAAKKVSANEGGEQKSILSGADSKWLNTTPDLNRILRTLGAQLEQHNYPEKEGTKNGVGSPLDPVFTVGTKATPRNNGVTKNHKTVQYQPGANESQSEANKPQSQATKKPMLLHTLRGAQTDAFANTQPSIQPRLSRPAPSIERRLPPQAKAAPIPEKTSPKEKARQIRRAPPPKRNVAHRRSFSSQPQAFWDRHYLGQLNLRMYR